MKAPNDVLRFNEMILPQHLVGLRFDDKTTLDMINGKRYQELRKVLRSYGKHWECYEIGRLSFYRQ